MSRAIPGLHHVTAISGPPQANVDFYVGTMRQRLVKTPTAPAEASKKSARFRPVVVLVNTGFFGPSLAV
jgi:catechol 2,3-dioxygenase-like lactoylglutathione lyase family enzyme